MRGPWGGSLAEVWVLGPGSEGDFTGFGLRAGLGRWGGFGFRGGVFRFQEGGL